MRERLNYLCSFFLPVSALFFLTGGPHGIAAAMAWTLPVWGLVLADRFGPKIDTRQTLPAPNIFFEAVLYGLALLQLANIALMLRFVAQLPFTTGAQWANGIANLVAVRILVGTSSGVSGISAAHELLHRSGRFGRMLGRLLLYTVCYDHFTIAHKRGHHLNAGNQKDIATARRGETFGCYWKRVFSGHIAYAWENELRRLKINTAPFGNRRILQHKVLHGLLLEALIIAAIIAVYGWLAAAAFLYQAFAAIRLLEAINYFQHWGLAEIGPVKAIAWVNDSWLTKYCLIGLPNHIGHHRDASKAFHQIPYYSDGPKMPYGYFVMNLWVKLDNRSYQKMAVQELENYERYATL